MQLVASVSTSALALAGAPTNRFMTAHMRSVVSWSVVENSEV